MAKQLFDAEFKTQNLNASEVVSSCMTDYALDVTANKIPSIVDGLKKVQRRALWTMRSYLDKEVVMNTYLGNVNEIHNFGDMSIINACMRVAQEHSMYTPLLYSRGNIGRYEAKQGGAPRYLKIQISEIAKDLFYKGVSLETLPMVETMDTMSLEPAYFIPRLPTALLFETLTIGVGTKAQILPLYFDNVCELVKRYIDELNKNPFQNPTLYGCEELFIPDTPIFNVIRNTSSLLDSYKNKIYDATVQVDGEIDILSSSEISIRTVPCNISFSKIKEYIDKEFANKKSWLYENTTEYMNLANEKSKGDLFFRFKKNINIFDAIKKIKELVSFSAGIKPIHNFTDKYGHKIKATPINLLDIWFRERKLSLIGGIKLAQKTNIRNIYNNQVKLIVAEHSDEIIKILRSDLSNEETCKILIDKYELSKNQAFKLLDTPIKVINGLNKQEIIDEIERLYAKAKQLKDELSDINNVIYRDAEYFQRKYHKPRIAKITPYKGYICVNGTNIIQFDSIDEALSLLNKFPSSTIKMFCDEMPHKYLVPNKPIIDKVKETRFDIPKVADGSFILESPSMDIYTLCIKDDTISCTKGLFYNNSNDDTLFIPITEKFTGINKDGTIVKMNVNDAAMRKKADARGKLSELIYAVPSCYKHFFIVHMNPIDPEVIRFDKVKVNQTEKVMFINSGKREYVLGIVPVGNDKPNEYIFNMPHWFNLKFLHIKHFKKLQNNRDNFAVTVTRKSKRNDVVRTMIEL